MNKVKPFKEHWGFVGALLKIIRMTDPTHIVVLFDGEHENDRTNLDHEYKANRTDCSQVSEEENTFSQLSDVYAALDYLHIVISSFDRDFFQLITDNMSVLRYRGDKTTVCTPDYIRNKLGIEPEQYVDFKSLTSDTADNIKEADKVGSKTAALLLNEFGSLERNRIKVIEIFKRKRIGKYNYYFTVSNSVHSKYYHGRRKSFLDFSFGRRKSD